MISEVLLWALFIGPTAAGVTVAFRALPWVAELVLARRKPWACDVCMSFWSTLLVVAFAGVSDPGAVLSFGPGFPLALLVLRKLTEPLRPPPVEKPLPELEES